MTARDLSPAERAIVERFDRAPDGLSEGRAWQAETIADLVADAHRIVGQIDGGCTCADEPHQNALHDLAVDTADHLARLVAEAADAREAEVRARVTQAIEAQVFTGPLAPDASHMVTWNDALRIARTAALAPADNDGEA